MKIELGGFADLWFKEVYNYTAYYGGYMILGTKTVIYGPTGIGKKEIVDGLGVSKSVIELKHELIDLKDPKVHVLKGFWSSLMKSVDSDSEVIVIHSLDILESLIFKDLMKSSECKSIEHVDGGYSKGYVRAKEKWESLFAWINEKVIPSGKSLIFTSAADTFDFKNPFGLQYSKFGLRINKHGAGVIESEMDNMLFMTHAGLFNPEKQGVVFHTRASIAFTAKNNCGLPDEINGLDFERYFKGKVLGHEQQ
jgi:hypothetical protein